MTHSQVKAQSDWLHRGALKMGPIFHFREISDMKFLIC